MSAVRPDRDAGAHAQLDLVGSGLRQRRSGIREAQVSARAPAARETLNAPVAVVRTRGEVAATPVRAVRPARTPRRAEARGFPAESVSLPSSETALPNDGSGPCRQAPGGTAACPRALHTDTAGLSRPRGHWPLATGKCHPQRSPVRERRHRLLVAGAVEDAGPHVVRARGKGASSTTPNSRRRRRRPGVIATRPRPSAAPRSPPGRRPRARPPRVQTDTRRIVRDRRLKRTRGGVESNRSGSSVAARSGSLLPAESRSARAASTRRRAAPTIIVTLSRVPGTSWLGCTQPDSSYGGVRSPDRSS